ncbi:MAG: leucine-rich repeat domain-containing protein, partial [Oscillospiraceae bacterium]|nr:leucine-rich repeat domain-containing protein [Oscillospiraceae bacterium]
MNTNLSKRITSVILALAMMFAVLPAGTLSAIASDGGTFGDGLTWSFDEGSGLLKIEGIGAMPDELTPPWGGSSTGITTVEIAEGVTRIGNKAFFSHHMTSVKISNSVQTIGSEVFMGSVNLTNVTIGSGVTFIDVDAFYACENLYDVYFSSAAPPAVDESYGPFDNVASGARAHVPAS